MRTLIIVIVCLFALSCSVSNEKKAQKLIVERLKETLHDYSSYESVKFGTLDSIFSTPMDDSVYFNAKVNLDMYLGLAETALEDVEMYKGSQSEYYIMKYRDALAITSKYVDSAKIYEPIVNRIEKNYKPHHKGWGMTHTLRSNNAMGNKTIGHFQYFFDENITKIVDSKDISESASK